MIFSENRQPVFRIMRKRVMRSGAAALVRRFSAGLALASGRAALCAAGCLASFPAFAAGNAVAGDGSHANNPELLRGSIQICAPGDAACDPFVYSQPLDLEAPAPEPMAQLAAPPVAAEDTGYGYPLGVSPVAVAEPDVPPFNLDWSVGLRGAYIGDDTGDHYEALVAPSASLTYEGTRALLALGTSAEIARPSDDDLRIGALRVTLGSDYKLDRSTQVSFNAALDISQDSPDDPMLPSSVISTPVVVGGTLESEMTRRFGHFDVALRGTLEREIYGNSTVLGGIEQDNTSSNRTLVGTGLRLSYAVTPITKIFVDGAAARDYFDAVSPRLGVRADGTNYALKTGVSAQWGERLRAEAAIGFGLRRFDAAELDEVSSTLYDARIVYNPTQSLTATGQFTTSLTPPGPNTSGTTRIEYAARGDIGYRVNSWLALRALVNWTYAELAGSSDIEKGYGLGVGADYIVNAHTSLTADYGFGHSETPSTRSSDAHRVTLGLTISR
jgi:hypothetical protein